MFERYTERARRALFFARFEASQFGSASIEPEHLLLGLLREGKGLTRRLFADAHLDLEIVRTELERRLPAGETLPTSAEIPFSAPARRILEYTAEEADRLGHTHIGTEHLLLGILREKDSLAATVLLDLGLHPDAVRKQLVGLLHDPAEEAAPPSIEIDLETPQQLAEEHARLRAFIEDMLKDPGLPIEFRDNAYWLRGEGQSAEGPYCSLCFDIDRRLVHKLTAADGTTYCEYCNEYRPKA